MGWLQLAVLAFQVIVRIWDAVREKSLEKRKMQTEALQSGIRGIVDRDVSRINAAINDLNGLR